MADPQRDFRLVSDDEPAEAREERNRAADVMMLALKALSQRALVSLAALYSLLTFGCVFFLAYLIIPNDPTVPKLVGLGGFAVFVLTLNLIERHK